MTVIIPHQDDMLTIAGFQSALQKRLNQSGHIFFCRKPLWLEPPVSAHDKSSLKSLGIKRLVMLAPEIKDGMIVSQVEMESAEGTQRFDFTHLYPLDDDAADFLCKNRAQIIPADFHAANPGKKILSFPKEFRIFRLGIAERLSHNSMAISDFVWIKLPKN